MTPAAALWWSLGLWVAGILVLLWLCLEADDVDCIEQDEAVSTPSSADRGRA